MRSITLRRVGLCSVSHCALSGNSNDRKSKKSLTLRAVWYCAESNNFIWFQKLQFPGLLGSIRWYFENVSKIFRKSKMGNTVQSRTPSSITLRRVLPRAILSFQASPCIDWEYKLFLKINVYYCNIAQHFLLTFKGLADQKFLTQRSITLLRVTFFANIFKKLWIQISSRKWIFKQHCLSGAQKGSIHENNRGQKSRDTASLRAVLHSIDRGTKCRYKVFRIRIEICS